MNSVEPQHQPQTRYQRIKRAASNVRWWEFLTFLAIAVTAGIAYWQGSLTRQALESGQRSFIVLKEAKFVPIVGAPSAPTVAGTPSSTPPGTTPPAQAQSAGVAWQFVPEWENAGNTPAIELVSRASLYSPNALLLPGFTRTDLVGDNINIGVLGPKATTNFGHFIEAQNVMVLLKASPNATLWGWPT